MVSSEEGNLERETKLNKRVKGGFYGFVLLHQIPVYSYNYRCDSEQNALGNVSSHHNWYLPSCLLMVKSSPSTDS